MMIDCAVLLGSSFSATFAYSSCDSDDIPTVCLSFLLLDSSERLSGEGRFEGRISYFS